MEETKLQLFPVLRSAYGGLTKSERRIADYIVNHTGEVMEQTVSDLAVHAQSSEITISRFCKKLGCSGLKELKLMLAAELSAAPQKTFHDIQAGDTGRDVAAKVFANIAEGLQDTLSLLDYDALDAAARLLLKARRIYVFGFGNSATVCMDMATRFLRLGLAIREYADSHMQVTAAALMTADDVVIAVSHSGASKELLQSVQAARENGAKVIVITSHGQSPLAALADICLCGMGREVQYTSEAGASRLIHMAIGDVLYTRVAMQEESVFRDNMEKMRREIGKKRQR
ncbi:MurR/RpiR family transcriptional regulator [uncultured Megasphaera sp.]|uniref:MurR/RpiR family transcriptional regulator n=1 Tax=uncultured Megasphaera sp. TaxID=165188 RepID=UPI0026DD2F5A|nr:MurR/RpiR family transcriptional regulator [uncultured Megasphaera sp.]